MISHKIKQNSSFKIRVGAWFETKSSRHMVSMTNGDEWSRYPYGWLDSYKWRVENSKIWHFECRRAAKETNENKKLNKDQKETEL